MNEQFPWDDPLLTKDLLLIRNAVSTMAAIGIGLVFACIIWLVY